MQEEVNDVQIQVHGCEDIFVDGKAVGVVLSAHYHLHVEDDVEAEEQRRESTVNHHYWLANRHEHQDETRKSQTLIFIYLEDALLVC